jgi:CRISPR-associated endoribonuclease Cas6
MLLSILISLTSVSSVPIFGALGRPIQAWFLNQVLQKHPQLAVSLHDDDGSKPYTVSTLLDRNGHPLKAGHWIKEGDECWLRVTTIGEEISEPILNDVIKKLPKGLSLYKMDFRVDGYTLNPHEHSWAGQTSFAEIAQDSQYVTVSREARMEFVSPTAFRSNGNDIALPVPNQIFRSLWQKWNAFCPESMQLQKEWPEFVEDCILVNELTAVNTVHWEFAEGTRGAATGFTGTVGFSLLPKSKINKKWQPFWDGADVVMQSLARYAFYCGVGHHATIGMGQVRLISSAEQKPQFRVGSQAQVQEKRRYGSS